MKRHDHKAHTQYSSVHVEGKCPPANRSLRLQELRSKGKQTWRRNSLDTERSGDPGEGRWVWGMKKGAWGYMWTFLKENVFREHRCEEENTGS